MYKKANKKQLSFLLPFDGKLDPENRWVKLSEIIPWDDIEEKYAELFPANCGMPAKPLRMALGAFMRVRLRIFFDIFSKTNNDFFTSCRTLYI